MEKKRSASEARRAILEAAFLLFAEKGFDGTAIKYVAKRAMVSQGLIYHHFQDKNALWASVKEDCSSRMQKALNLHRLNDKEKSLWVRFQKQLLFVINYGLHNQDVYRIYMWGILDKVPEAKMKWNLLDVLVTDIRKLRQLENPASQSCTCELAFYIQTCLHGWLQVKISNGVEEQLLLTEKDVRWLDTVCSSMRLHNVAPSAAESL